MNLIFPDSTPPVAVGIIIYVLSTKESNEVPIVARGLLSGTK